MPITARRSGLRAIALVVVFAGTLTIAAHAASGFEPAKPSQIPDSAFQPVTVPSAAPATSAAALAAPAGLPAATPNLAPVYDPVVATAPPERAQPSLPAPDRVVVVVPTPAPRTTHAISGAASWYCRAGVSPCTNGYPDGGGFNAYAAAGPRLRAALGDWRGRIVYVDGIRVKLIDWCQCYEGQSNEKLLDLYYDVFARTGSPVTVRW